LKYASTHANYWTTSSSNRTHDMEVLHQVLQTKQKFARVWPFRFLHGMRSECSVYLWSTECSVCWHVMLFHIFFVRYFFQFYIFNYSTNKVALHLFSNQFFATQKSTTDLNLANQKKRELNQHCDELKEQNRMLSERLESCQKESEEGKSENENLKKTLLQLQRVLYCFFTSVLIYIFRCSINENCLDCLATLNP